MADGLACISDALGAKSLEQAVKLASESHWLDCCVPLPIPSIPLRLATVEQSWLHDMRAKNHDDEQGTVAAYNAWVTARASAVAENECRLRGAMWCWRRLRAEHDASPDPALKAMCRRVRSFLADQWGVTDPPMNYADAHAMAVSTVQGRVTG
jgi:hypothetical protein